MVVQHNLTAMNSNRMLGLTAASQSKSTEKLSSGYKINRAADDAAGLSISEKMRRQIRGLTQASLNAQDGISAVQTAEGALNEVHDMLQRMDELATKAANGTLTDDDRQAVQKEIDQLVTEIDRVSETTTFNELQLLKGGKAEDAAGTEETVGTEETAGTEDAAGAGDPPATLTATATASDGLTVDVTEGYNTAGSYKYFAADADGSVDGAAHEAGWYAADVDFENDDAETLAAKTGLPSGISVSDGTPQANDTITVTAATPAADGGETEGAGETGGTGETAETSKDAAGSTAAPALKFSLHVGSEVGDENKITVEIKAMSAAGIGIDKLKGDGVMTQDDATAAIDTIKNAIKEVSAQRSELGAVQNRLEHTINNLDNVVENTTAAESQIRDTDMATEMVKFSNNNILAQAGQSMLAQANQSNQGVLSLLG
ncbi:MAG: hypothetical protein IJ716_07340 [Lachnospiraceae bacterium]|nr:hypothetical protein [Lachnospiraceae bacterium]